jgi:CspA family cold shock protein
MSKRWAVPTGKVKWYDAEKGFGFLSDDEGADVFLHADALPEGVATLKGGTRVEFGVVQGRRGAQALSVRVLDPMPSMSASVAAKNRTSPEDLTVIVEDVIKLLDSVSTTLHRGRYPDKATAGKVAKVLRGIAAQLETGA